MLEHRGSLWAASSTSHLCTSAGCSVVVGSPPKAVWTWAWTSCSGCPCRNRGWTQWTQRTLTAWFIPWFCDTCSTTEITFSNIEYWITEWLCLQYLQVPDIKIVWRKHRIKVFNLSKRNEWCWKSKGLSSLLSTMLQFNFWVFFFLDYFHNVLQYEELSKSKTIWFWQMPIPLLYERRVAVKKENILILHVQVISLLCSLFLNIILPHGLRKV